MEKLKPVDAKVKTQLGKLLEQTGAPSRGGDADPRGEKGDASRASHVCSSSFACSRVGSRVFVLLMTFGFEELHARHVLSGGRVEIGAIILFAQSFLELELSKQRYSICWVAGFG